MTEWLKNATFRRDQRKRILFFIAFILSAIIFSLIATQIYMECRLPIDEPVLLFIHDFTSPLLTTFFTTITHLGDSIIALIIAAMLTLYYLYRHIYQKLFIVAVGIGGVAVWNIILKSIFQRDRPDLWQHLVEETNFSFPSGHAMLSAALTAILIILFWNTKFRWPVTILSVAVMVLVGLSRLYLGVHYPSDIIAGWCVSTAWVLIVSVSTSYLFQKIASSKRA